MHRLRFTPVVALWLGSACGTAAVPEPPPAASAEPRWPADPVTVVNVEALQSRVASLRAADRVTRADRDALRAAYLGIFRDCTMEGDAHHALHDLLMPVDDLLDRLDDPARSADALAALDEHLKGFDKAFALDGTRTAP